VVDTIVVNGVVLIEGDMVERMVVIVDVKTATQQCVLQLYTVYGGPINAAPPITTLLYFTMIQFATDQLFECYIIAR